MSHIVNLRSRLNHWCIVHDVILQAKMPFLNQNSAKQSSNLVLAINLTRNQFHFDWLLQSDMNAHWYIRRCARLIWYISKRQCRNTCIQFESRTKHRNIVEHCVYQTFADFLIQWRGLQFVSFKFSSEFYQTEKVFRREK